MRPNGYHIAAAGLLGMMFLLAGGAALRESVTVDEVSHVAAGLSYWQRLDLRVNPEHPPLAKLIAAVPNAIRRARADYSSPAWQSCADFFQAYGAQWVFGDAVLGRWNPWKPVLLWARLPMLLLTLLLGWVLYRYAARIGGPWGGLLCLAAYVTTPAFLVFGPLVLTDVPVTLFLLVALWQLGEIWKQPSRGNALRFGAASTAAVLSKFTGLLLGPIVLALFLQTRFRPTKDEPVKQPERKLWRRERWRCVLRGGLWAAAFVYVFYFVFSWNQPDDALDRLGSGTSAWVIRRPLMPIWLFTRGLLITLLTASRPTYLFGRSLPHGVPYYFPVVFTLKSTLGFLLLLVLAAAAAFASRRLKVRPITEAVRPHWRVLMVGFFVVLVVCLLSQLDISIRHFMLPIALLILMLAPLPRMLGTLRRGRLWQAVALLLVAMSFVPILRAYPYYFPFVNSLSFGRPVYTLLNDSNVSWNEALPAVGDFARQGRLAEIPLDWASLSDPALVVPQARIWNCQTPAENDAGRWVAVTAISILENHNCGYLLSYPHRELAGGSFYAFQLPAVIPPPGAAGGPPLASQHKLLWGMPIDLREWGINVERHPDQFRAEMQKLIEQFQGASRKNGAARKK